MKRLAQNQRRTEVKTRARVSNESRRSAYRALLQKGRVTDVFKSDGVARRYRFEAAPVWPLAPKLVCFGSKSPICHSTNPPKREGETRSQFPRIKRESYREFNPQGQYYRTRRRSAVCSAFCGKLSPGYRNANNSDRHA